MLLYFIMAWSKHLKAIKVFIYDDIRYGASTKPANKENMLKGQERFIADHAYWSAKS